jgi:hypothetical protein
LRLNSIEIKSQVKAFLTFAYREINGCEYQTLEVAGKEKQRDAGIEPASSAWEANVLPLYESRLKGRLA